MEQISNLFDNYLKDLKVVWQSTLFPPNWDALKIDRCPICGNRLKFPRNKSISFCNGKKHAKNFVIRLDRLKKIKEIDYTKSIPVYKNM